MRLRHLARLRQPVVGAPGAWGERGWAPPFGSQQEDPSLLEVVFELHRSDPAVLEAFTEGRVPPPVQDLPELLVWLDQAPSSRMAAEESRLVRALLEAGHHVELVPGSADRLRVDGYQLGLGAAARALGTKHVKLAQPRSSVRSEPRAQGAVARVAGDQVARSAAGHLLGSWATHLPILDFVEVGTRHSEELLSGDGEALRDAAEELGAKTAGAKAGALIGGGVGAALLAALGPAAAWVGAKGGTVLGGWLGRSLGASWAYDRRARRVAAALEQLEVALSDYARIWLEGLRTKERTLDDTAASIAPIGGLLPSFEEVLREKLRHRYYQWSAHCRQHAGDVRSLIRGSGLDEDASPAPHVDCARYILDNPDVVEPVFDPRLERSLRKVAEAGRELARLTEKAR